jgi:hypothetical protein
MQAFGRNPISVQQLILFLIRAHPLIYPVIGRGAQATTRYIAPEKN